LKRTSSYLQISQTTQFIAFAGLVEAAVTASYYDLKSGDLGSIHSMYSNQACKHQWICLRQGRDKQSSMSGAEPDPPRRMTSSA